MNAHCRHVIAGGSDDIPPSSAGEWGPFKGSPMVTKGGSGGGERGFVFQIKASQQSMRSQLTLQDDSTVP
ncbi:hypothetical protein N9M41_01195 [Rhodopirellula sp.]|nr:hypothetical protein [Rhodopirellula sp.]MDA9778043.1 hypothetical protein [Rubripirellula sp.]